jgi:hypothetical protein
MFYFLELFNSTWAFDVFVRILILGFVVEGQPLLKNKLRMTLKNDYIHL